MKNILVCFDGTGNEPEDAEQSVSKSGKLEDNNITNVLKIHLLAGGSLDNAEGNVEGQRSLYYSGVGTRGSIFRRLVRTAFAARGPKVILKKAHKDLAKIYKKGDRLYLFGFSRGAALARMFASTLSKQGMQTRKRGRSKKKGGRTGGAKPPIEMLGVWDTVASFGKPELHVGVRPATDVVFENGTIARTIRNAYHLVSLDENRLAFRPTLMNAREGITEVWFAGVHSDVGGGYRIDGLSDITLQFMMNKAEQHGLKFLSLGKLFERLSAKDAHDIEVRIDREDVVIEPDSGSKIHSHEHGFRRSEKVQHRTLAPRDVVVTHDDEVSTDLPVIHFTVADRIRSKRKYRPDNLRDVRHQVLGRRGATRECRGLKAHTGS